MLEQFEESTIEKYLGPILNQIKYLAQGTSFATVVARFETAEELRKFSIRVLIDENLALLPLYIGRRTSRMKIKSIPPEMEVAWIIITLLFGREVKFKHNSYFQRLPHHTQKTLEILAQAAAIDFENLPEKIHIGEDKALIVNCQGLQIDMFQM